MCLKLNSFISQQGGNTISKSLLDLQKYLEQLLIHFWTSALTRSTFQLKPLPIVSRSNMPTTQPSWKFYVAVPSSDQLWAFHARLSFFSFVSSASSSQHQQHGKCNIFDHSNRATRCNKSANAHKPHLTVARGRPRATLCVLRALTLSHKIYILRAGKAGQTFSERFFVCLNFPLPWFHIAHNM